MGRYANDYWRPYVPVAERRRQAAKKLAKLKKAGCEVAPVEIAGRRIAVTFWGDAWCKNLEAYSDYANRLPRGRTYVRNGSVIDLQIEAGRVRAVVSGSEIYEVDIKIKPLVTGRWAEIKEHCAGRIDSLVELLKGSISKSVMEIVTRKGQGLFPSPQEITLDCSCPDWATMCKHVAAALYGVGARLDQRPELLFTLRGVDPAEMIEAAVDRPPAAFGARKGRVLETDELSSVFGIDIDMGQADPPAVATAAKPAKAGRRSAAAGKKAAPRTNTEKPVAKAVAKKISAKKGVAAKATAKKAAAKKTSTKNTSTKRTKTRKPARTKSSTGKPVARKPAGTK